MEDNIPPPPATTLFARLFQCVTWYNRHTNAKQQIQLFLQAGVVGSLQCFTFQDKDIDLLALAQQAINRGLPVSQTKKSD